MYRSCMCSITVLWHLLGGGVSSFHPVGSYVSLSIAFSRSLIPDNSNYIFRLQNIYFLVYNEA